MQQITIKKIATKKKTLVYGATLWIDFLDDYNIVEEPSVKKQYKCQCNNHSQQITIMINIYSRIVGCLSCGKIRLVIGNHQIFFNYLVDIGKKCGLLNEIEISLKFRTEGNYLQPIIKSGDLHQLLTVNLFQNFFSLCNINGIAGKETFANKIKRNQEFLPFTYDELSNMKIIEGSSNQMSKKRDTMDGFENNLNKNNKKSRQQ